MDRIKRFAIYYAPREGEFAEAAARWLGWDLARGRTVGQPALPGIAALTAEPRKYGFHGTIKPPFRLAAGLGADDLAKAVRDLSAELAPVRLPGLDLVLLEGFLALVPPRDPGLSALAARVVGALDPFRAALTEAEIARRRPDRLTDRQRAHLAQWGYPYVMEDFQFHLTLSGDLTEPEAETVATALTPMLAPILPRPFRVGSLCLFGQGSDKMFRLLHRYTLSG
jgi:putative phosphonate metabolism protein